MLSIFYDCHVNYFDSFDLVKYSQRTQNNGNA